MMLLLHLQWTILYMFILIVSDVKTTGDLQFGKQKLIYRAFTC